MTTPASRVVDEGRAEQAVTSAQQAIDALTASDYVSIQAIARAEAHLHDALRWVQTAIGNAQSDGAS